MKIFGIEIIVRKYIPEKKWYLYDPEFTNIAGEDFNPKNWVMSKGDNVPLHVSGDRVDGIKRPQNPWVEALKEYLK